MKTPWKLFLLAAVCTISLAALVGAGKPDSNITAKSLWVYPFEMRPAEHFQDVTILDKTATGIRFRAGDKVYEHCGHYIIEN